ncbi:MAG: S8 family serine peptidase [Euzebyaceae bacterium]|jgi:subtilisin family serine protease|nr:S8 family serine peptidase [Euzebyaceae bacterium]
MFPFARHLLLTVLLLPALLGLPAVAASAATQTDSGTARLSDSRYLVVLDTSTTAAQARSLVTAAGGTVAADYTRQMGVLVAESTVAGFADALRASGLVDEIGADFSWQGLPEGGPEPSSDPAEALQWDMQQIRTEQAHAVQAGARAVDVGILDSGTDGQHPDFAIDGQGSNVDCKRGRDFVLGNGPGVGNPNPCVDNQFHGTHVSGTVAAQANGIGIVGVAPNVTLVPVKVCDTSGYCYASSVVDGITYAGDAQLDVINMSFFVDDNEFQESTEFKCNSDPVQRAFRKAVERAVQYARSQGVTPVAALGNSDQDLAHPVDDDGEPISNECEVVPAETQGVIGTASLGRNSEKAGYSNYGTGATDVAAPGGNGTTGDCRRTVLSTFPAGTYGCIQGTSMASPHAAGVAALIVSQIGTLGADGDVKASPTKVEAMLQNTAIDIGLRGYDECFGNGRIDALRAVTADTSAAADDSAPDCPEYSE